MPNSVVVVVAGDDKTGQVFDAVKKHLDETKSKAKETSESLGEMGETLKRGLEAAGIAVGLREVVGRFQELIKSSMEMAVQIGHMSKQTGISTENLSVLRYMANATGIDFETLGKGFKKFSETIVDADSGGKKAVETFARLGVTQAQVKATGNDMFRMLELVANKFAQMPDGVLKNAEATALFGRAGQELIPVLDQGAAGVETFRKEAESLGLVLNEDGIQKMEEMHEATEQMKGSIAGLGLEITSFLSGPLSHAADQLSAYIKMLREHTGETIKFTLIGYGDDPFEAAYKSVRLDKRIADFNSSQINKDDLTNWINSQPKNKNLDTLGDGGDGKKNEMAAQMEAEARQLAAAVAKWQQVAHVTIQARQRALELWHDQLANEAADAERDRIAGQKEWDEVTKVALNQSISGIFPNSTANVTLAKQPWLDPAAVEGEAEKFAHGVFDPLFNFGEKWENQWKQIRANMLRDLGQFAESQLFGALFGDASGRGGKGWNGMSFHGDTSNPRAGLQGAGTGLVGGILGKLFNRGAGAASNGGLGSGAGTVPTPAASLMQMGNKGASGAGGIQVILNNNGTPLQVDQTQQQNDGGESQVIQIMLKQLETNGPVAQGIAGMMASGL
jgi:hypothetical protein